jgi:hypothetical protein
MPGGNVIKYLLISFPKHLAGIISDTSSEQDSRESYRFGWMNNGLCGRLRDVLPG